MDPKRALLLAATSSCALLLVGCGGGGTTTQAPTPSPSPAAPNTTSAPLPICDPAPAPNNSSFVPELYCPDNSSFEGIVNDDGRNVTWSNDGWISTGWASVQGKTSFNLLGGYVEFDVDNSGVTTGINNNIYTISPNQSYIPAVNCDGQGATGSTKNFCMELDLYQSSSPNDLRTVWHTRDDQLGDCDKSGCAAHLDLSGQFHVKAEFDSAGWMHMYFNGNKVTDYDRCPSNASRDFVRETMIQRGVALRSSQWIETTVQPPPDIMESTFSISNIRVFGSVVFGPEPPKCQSGAKEVLV